MDRGNRHKTYDTATDGSTGLIRRMAVSWVGLFLLVFNIIGGGALPARAAEAGPAPFAQDILLGDRIVVCTAVGMVVMDHDGNILDTGNGVGHTDVCVFCLPLLHGNVQAPALVALVVHQTPAAPPSRGFAATVLSVATPAGLTGAATPRAPPIA